MIQYGIKKKDTRFRAPTHPHPNPTPTPTSTPVA